MLRELKKQLKQYINDIEVIPLYQGKCDVTELFCFSYIIRISRLTHEDHNKLIEYGQKLLNKRIKILYYGG